MPNCLKSAKRKKLLLFGGTFDPPHNGHLNNLHAALNEIGPDHVIVMPAGIPPHKNASETPAEWRLAMCSCFEALFQNDNSPSFELSRWEIDRSVIGEKNYTWLTMQMLADKYPDMDLYLSVGSDMFLTFEKWYHWQDILQNCVLVVESRSKNDYENLEKKEKALSVFGARVKRLSLPAVEAASSDIRSGKLGLEHVPESVREFIVAHHLYGR